MSAGRDDEVRTKKRKKQIARAEKEWKEHRKEVKSRKRIRRKLYRENHKP